MTTTQVKTALIRFSKASNKWQAVYGSQLLTSSQHKKNVIYAIENGTSRRAAELGITSWEELGSATEQVGHSTPLIEFDINERFEFLENFVDMCAQRDMKSTIICGSGGLGKTFTVKRQLARNGISEIIPQENENDETPEEIKNLIGNTELEEYIVVKGYSTAKGLYRTLCENRNRLVIFDDADNILKDPVATNILKAALDSYDRRIVTWNSESSFSGSDLPKSFEFTGAIIFISNLNMCNIPQALISRSATADVSMTRHEVVERMRMIVSEGEFMDDVDMNIKNDALDFIEEHIDNAQIKTINLRTLIAVVTNRRCKPANWQRLSLSMMISAR